MNGKSVKRLGLWLCLLGTVSLPVQAGSLFPDNHYNHRDASQESWLFSGTAKSEVGQEYGYFFSVVRMVDKWSMTTQVIDLKTNRVILSNHSVGDFNASPLALNWKAGDAFIRYSAINDSWLFGFRNNNKQSVNFRLDALKSFSPVTDLINHSGPLDFYTHQSKRMNGSIVSDGQEIFVTAHNAWIQHQWVSKPNKSYQLTQVQCRFASDNGYYLLSVKSEGKTQFKLADWLSGEGGQQPVSQFSQIKKTPEGGWSMTLKPRKAPVSFLPGQSLNYSLNSLKISFDAGAVDKHAFCVLASLVWEERKQSQKPAVNKVE